MLPGHGQDLPEVGRSEAGAPTQLFANPRGRPVELRGADVEPVRHRADAAARLQPAEQRPEIPAPLQVVGKLVDEGRAEPGLQIFKDHGYGWIRLRLFHTPDRLPNNLEYTIALAREAKEMGYKFLLDYHYSDTWADPAKQYIPEAWEGKSHEELVQAVFEYETIQDYHKTTVIRNNRFWHGGGQI